MNVLVVDDHTAIRIGLKQILTDHAGARDVCEARTGRQALDSLHRRSFDAVVLDIDLPDMSGFEILREIRKSEPDLPVLILSMFPEDQYAIRALKAGASGYLSKDSAEDELVLALETIIDGKTFISREAAQHMAVYLGRGDPGPKHEMLSNREFQIMRLMATGKTHKQIAETLDINVKTVFTYRSRIFEKMGMSTNAEVIHYAIAHRLI